LRPQLFVAVATLLLRLLRIEEQRHWHDNAGINNRDTEGPKLIPQPPTPQLLNAAEPDTDPLAIEEAWFLPPDVAYLK
jgi:hypothetical protein